MCEGVLSPKQSQHLLETASSERTSASSQRHASLVVFNSNSSLRRGLDQFQSDAIRVKEINGIASLIHPRFDGDRFVGFELNTQSFESFELPMNLIHHEGPLTNAAAIRIPRNIFDSCASSI